MFFLLFPEALVEIKRILRHCTDLAESIDANFMKICRVIPEIDPDRQTTKKNKNTHAYFYRMFHTSSALLEKKNPKDAINSK